MILALAVGARSCRPTAEDPVTRPAEDPPAESMAATGDTSLLIGTTYTHHSFESCSFAGSGIVNTYHLGENAQVVHGQLAAMRAGGIQSLRLIIWHMRDIPRQDWGVVPSRGGRLASPYRENLVAFLQEVRAAGFLRLTVSFSPQWTNSPTGDNYDPGRFEENWSFIQDVRALVQTHGPPQARFDLLNEGAPSDHAPMEQQQRVRGYMRQLWRRYADRFGTADATISVIAPEDPRDQGRRLENLLATLTDADAPPPSWIELHLNTPASGVAWSLSYADSVLRDHGLDGPLTVGETSYDDSSVARAIQAFSADAERPLTEVIQGYRRAGADCQVSPPYEAHAYLRLLR